MSDSAQLKSEGSQFHYVFLDEGGDLNFKTNGTRFYTLTSVSAYGLPQCHAKFEALPAELLARGHGH